MKIVIVAQTFVPQKEGGAEIVTRRAAEVLGQCNDVRVLSLERARDPIDTALSGVIVDRLPFRWKPLPEVGKQAGRGPIARASWHMANAFGGLRAKDLAEYLERVRPDVIYAHNAGAFQPQLGMVAARMAVPIVQHVHDYAYLCPRTSMYRKGQNCARQCVSCRLLTARWRKAAAISTTDAIAVSEFVRDRLRAAGVMPHARWHVLHNVEPPERLLEFRRAPRIDGGHFTFGFLGTLVPEKGLAHLVEAFLSLPPGRARLIVGGRGEEGFARTLQRATHGHAVEWRGHVDANSLLAETDALVVPSLWHEPQALVVTEGVNRRLMVIGSARGGTTEVLRGYAGGILFDPDQPGALRQAMEKAMSLAPAETGPATGQAFEKYFGKISELLQIANQQSRLRDPYLGVRE